MSLAISSGAVTAAGLRDLIDEQLAECRIMDAIEPRSPQEGWRDPGAIKPLLPGDFSMEKIVDACDKLVDAGRLEVRCGDVGWIWYRAHRDKA